MSTEEQSTSVDEMVEPVDKNGIPGRTFNWNGIRFINTTKTNKPSNQLATFVYADINASSKKELPAASLELNDGKLNLLFKENDDEIVNKIIINKENRSVTITTSTTTYEGSVKQILQIHNADSNSNQKKPKTKELHEFIVKYKTNSENDNVPKELDEPEPKPRKRQRNKTIQKSSTSKSPQPPKVARLSVGKLEKQNLFNLKNRISKTVIPDHENRYLSLDVLESDFTVRSPSEEDVNVILEQLKDGKWKSDDPFIVNKLNDSEFYSVIIGNTQLAAFKKFNEETADKNRQIKTINCRIYKDLNFDLKILINAEIQNAKAPEFETTIIQQTKLLHTIVEKHSVAKPTSKKEISGIVSLADLYLPKNYSPICAELLTLPNDTLNSIYETTVKSVPLEHLKISVNFWKNFISAAKKNSNIALGLINELEDKTAEDVEKLLKNVEIDLLEYLKKRGQHDFVTEEEAITTLTGGKVIGKNDLIKALKAKNWLQNKKRDGSNWDGIAQKITAYFEQNSAYSNTEFVEQVDDSLLSKQNFVIVQNPTTELKTLLEKYINNFTLLSLGNLGEDPPAIHNFQPIAIFKVTVHNPVVVDKVIDQLPQTSTKVHLYIPNAPESNDEKERIKFLSQLCITKKCPLASDWNIDKIHEIAKLASSYDNILFCNTSLTLTQHFLSNLNYYQNITVTGEDELKELVATCISEADETCEIATEEVHEGNGFDRRRCIKNIHAIIYFFYFVFKK